MQVRRAGGIATSSNAAVYNLIVIPKSRCARTWHQINHQIQKKTQLVYPSDTPDTPGTPAKGKGMLGVTISEPLPLPSHTLHQNPGVFKTPVILYLELRHLLGVVVEAEAVEAEAVAVAVEEPLEEGEIYPNKYP